MDTWVWNIQVLLHMGMRHLGVGHTGIRICGYWDIQVLGHMGKGHLGVGHPGTVTYGYQTLGCGTYRHRTYGYCYTWLWDIQVL